MNQKFNIALKLSFAVYLILTAVTAIFKLDHLPLGNELLIATVFSAIIFISLAIYEVTQSSRFSKNEKFMWTISFIFFSGIAGAVYLMLGRKRLTYKNW
ncbi:MAG: hypothetical protein EPO57_07130 [Chitinophagaceae bacterium]|nr:MAG: hypothetical protein EPO57_07130 [Chitinophagaceae bacterium]